MVKNSASDDAVVGGVDESNVAMSYRLLKAGPSVPSSK